MKKLTVLVSVMMFILCGCARQKKEETPAETAAPEASAVPEAEREDIYIFYTSDVHCGVEENMGLPALKALVEDTKAEHEYVSLVDLGDYIQGGTLGSLSHGEIIIDLMNAMDYDLVTFGNHEFDYTIPTLSRLIDQAEFKMLASNVKYTGKGKNAFADVPEYAVIDYGPVRVGFLGILTPETTISSTPSYFMEDGEFVYDFYSGNEGKELAERVQSLVDELRGQGCDYVVALSHLGSIPELAPYDSVNLIRNTSGIDVVLDGHSHSVIIGDVYQNKNGEDVILSSVGTMMENAGELIIGKDGTIETMLVSEYSREDEGMKEAIAEANAALEGILSEKVGELPFTLTISDENGIRQVRCRETNCGNFSADAVRELMGTDVAVLNGGGVRHTIEAGEVTYNDLLNVMPFQSVLASAKCTGQQIIDVLEYCSAKVQSASVLDGNPLGEFGGFLQVSNLKYTIDTSVEPSIILDENNMFAGIEGNRRVSDVMIKKDGEYVPIDPEGEYTIASTRYVLFEKGDGNAVLADCEPIVENSLTDVEALAYYFSFLDEIPENYRDTEGRITVK